MIINKINELIEKQNKYIKILLLTLPFLILIYFYFSYVIKEVKLVNFKKNELIYLEKEYNTIVKNNLTIIELNSTKEKLTNLENEINNKNNVLFENFRLYHWENIEKIVKENLLTANIYSKNDKEIMIYGNDMFLNIFRDITIFEKRYSKYKIDFFSYNVEDKSYKLKILNIGGDKK